MSEEILMSFFEKYKYGDEFCKLKEENKELKDQLKAYQNHYVLSKDKKQDTVADLYEQIWCLETTNKKLKSKIRELECQNTRLEPICKGNEVNCRVTIRDLKAEIETLKRILKFTYEDEQEWANHKKMFDFMIQKDKVKDEDLKNTNHAFNVARDKVRELTKEVERLKVDSESLIELKENTDKLEKELKMYKEFFSGNRVEVVLNGEKKTVEEVN